MCRIFFPRFLTPSHFLVGKLNLKEKSIDNSLNTITEAIGKEMGNLSDYRGTVKGIRSCTRQDLREVNKKLATEETFYFFRHEKISTKEFVCFRNKRLLRNYKLRI